MNTTRIKSFHLQAASKTIQLIVHYVGFVCIFEFPGKHVEYTHKSITSSPINFWLREKNAAFVGLDNFLSSEANLILNIVLGVDTLTGVGLNYIFSARPPLISIISRNYIYNMKINFVNYYWQSKNGTNKNYTICIITSRHNRSYFKLSTMKRFSLLLV